MAQIPLKRLHKHKIVYIIIYYNKHYEVEQLVAATTIPVLGTLYYDDFKEAMNLAIALNS